MNLQTLSIILIIIVLPITLILSAYTKTQIDTLSLQTVLKTQLRDATYSAVSAFQINTEDNDYSTVSDSMRRDISASIQTFMTNFGNNIGVSGATGATLETYIPAIVFTLYDGYYIYSPSLTTITDSEGKEQSKYEHVLKPYIYYAVRYKHGDNIDIIVNYTLDNYIVITGNVNGKYVTKAGYLVADDEKSYKDKIHLKETLVRTLPVTTIVYTEKENKNLINDVGIYDVELAEVVTTSPIMEVDRLSNGRYLTSKYNSETGEGIFINPLQLSINKELLIDENGNLILDENGNIKYTNVLREKPTTINLSEVVIKSKSNLASNRKYYIQKYIIGGKTSEKISER